MLTRSEEDHLKAVYSLLQDGEVALTGDIAVRLRTKASSVTDMLKRLAEKGLLRHEPYRGVRLTAKGRGHALQLVRRHRLWETFLVQRLGFRWDEVHEVAEQLEHVADARLTDRLDDHLGNPEFDPHGDPIPDSKGRIRERKTRRLHDCPAGSKVRIAAVSGTSDGLLQLLDAKGLRIGTRITVVHVHGFDGSMDIRPATGDVFSLSKEVGIHIHVQRDRS